MKEYDVVPVFNSFGITSFTVTQKQEGLSSDCGSLFNGYLM